MKNRPVIQQIKHFSQSNRNLLQDRHNATPMTTRRNNQENSSIVKRTGSRRSHSRHFNKLQRPQVIKRCISVIIPACNEESTLKQTLRMLKRWKRVQEVIVVANGCHDSTAKVARQAGAQVLEYPDPLGHDTGRAIGAAVAQGKYLLFVDADINWRREDLIPFIRSLERGADITLNAYPLPNDRFFHHPTAVAKRSLNIVLNRPTLKACSLTAVPHAMRRSVLPIIGIRTLAVPPLAQARAILADLKVVSANYIDVRRRNRWNPRYKKGYITKDVILGDHLQAIQYVVRQRGERAGFSDFRRQRQAIKQYMQENQEFITLNVSDKIHFSDSSESQRVVAVIPAKDEEKTIGNILCSLKKLQVDSILVVDNGSQDKTGLIAQTHGAQVFHFPDALGHDVGRSVGAVAAGHPKCLLIVDADFAVPSKLLQTFVNQVLEQNVDLALNDISKGLPLRRRTDSVSTMKSFLNMVLQRPSLGVSSLTAVPHAFSQRALQTIPVADFAVPPKAMVRAVCYGLNVQPVRFVNVIQRNRYRPKIHDRRHGAPLAQMIVGDHVEALALWLKLKGERGGFVQPRRLDVLEVLS